MSKSTTSLNFPDENVRLALLLENHVYHWLLRESAEATA
jgi:hypothetical protein